MGGPGPQTTLIMASQIGRPASDTASGKATDSTTANARPAFLDGSDGQGRSRLRALSACPGGSFRCGLPGEAILQASVPELIDRPDGAKDVALAGIVKEPQQAGRGVPAHGKLSKRQ